MSRKQRKKKAPRQPKHSAEQVERQMAPNTQTGDMQVGAVQGDVLDKARQLRAALTDTFDRQGDSGLLRFGQYVYEEWHKQLNGKKAVRMWREINDNDVIAGISMNYIQLFIRQMSWDVEAADDSPEAERWADFTLEVINDMDDSWKDMVQEMVSFVPYGFSLMEEVFKLRKGELDPDVGPSSQYDDGLIGLKSMEIRAQETLDGWLYDEDDGRVIGMFQQPPFGGRRLVHLNRALHLRYRTEKNNPEGRSAYRSIFTSYIAAKTLRWIEGVAYERDSGGTPIMELPLDVLEGTDADALDTVQTYMTIVQQMKRDEREGIIIPSELDSEGNPSGYKLRSYRNEGGSTLGSLHNAILRYEQKGSMALMTEFALLGSTEHGSFSMHDDKTSNFAMFVDAIADTIEGGLNTQTFRRLFDYNGVPMELRPKLKHGEIKKRSMSELGAYMASMFGVGLLTPTPEDEEYVREVGDLPQRGRDEGM